MVGRSRAYWDYCFPKLVSTLPQFAGMDQDTFYLGLHRVQPSLKRIASDEVTYSLHAILRFELERDYFAGKLQAEDMAQDWNQKYQDYLGLCPPDDTQGVLQDMHWAGEHLEPRPLSHRRRAGQAHHRQLPGRPSFPEVPG